jgi:hypothetical protein
MLIEIWERLRGYDKWVEAEAKIESSDISTYYDRQGEHEQSSDILKWTDVQGETHTSAFTVPEDSSLYQNVAGQAIMIRYSSADPGRYYLRELLQIRMRKLVRFAVPVLLLIGLVVVWKLLGMKK